MSEGWIKLHRQIRKHWIWNDSAKLKAWLDILMEVNHEPTKVNIQNRLIECGRGQSLNSQLTWAKRWKWSKSAVRRFFVLLENDSMIVLENVQKTTRLTVCNYTTYQDTRTDPEPILNRLRTDPEPILNTNKNEKNDKNEKKQDKGAERPAETFWNLYPNKVDRMMFDVQWMKGHCDDIADTIILALKNQIRERELKTKYGLFVPVWKHPKSWIAGKCWNDTVQTEPEIKAQSKVPKQAPEPNYKDYRA